MSYIKKFNKQTIKQDIERLINIIENTKDPEIKKTAYISILYILEFTNQTKKINIDYNNINIDNNLLTNLLKEEIKKDFPPQEVKKKKEETLDEKVYNNYIDLGFEINTMYPNKIETTSFPMNKKTALDLFFLFQKKYFPEDLQITKDIFTSGRIEISKNKYKGNEHFAISSNIDILQIPYILIKYPEINSEILESLAHEFGHISQKKYTSGTVNLKYMPTILDEVPSCYHEFKFNDYFYYMKIDNDLKKLKYYEECYQFLREDINIIDYVYAQIICDIFRKQEQENKDKFKKNLQFLKKHMEYLDDFEILDRFNITEKDIIEMKETKDNYLKLAKIYKR